MIVEENDLKNLTCFVFLNFGKIIFVFWKNNFDKNEETGGD